MALNSTKHLESFLIIKNLSSEYIYFFFPDDWFNLFILEIHNRIQKCFWFFFSEKKPKMFKTFITRKFRVKS